jgi:regulator of cell morphogenesis and NO signaling
MSELNRKSLAQIVNENHRSAYVFEKYQIDFCCKGKRMLQQACEEIAVPVDQVIYELEVVRNDSKVAVDFDEMLLTNLADYIELTHHAYVRKEMPLISSYIQKVASKHGWRHPGMLKVFDAFTELRHEMTEHMQKEEVILFPRIRMIETHLAGSDETLLNRTYLELPIAMMELEHEHAGDLLKEIRLLTNDFTLPDDACTTFKLCFAALQAFELDLHQHVHLENNILFPKAIKLFNKLKKSHFN